MGDQGMLTAKQIRAARGVLDWSVRDLAGRIGASPNTISRLENGGKGMAETLENIEQEFLKAGISFPNKTTLTWSEDG
jgi:transcriptional regulator with XRE-family HTH domain